MGFTQTDNDVRHVYCITRRDLSIPQQAVQACHAAIEASIDSLISSEEDPPHLVLCTARTLRQLENCEKKLARAGVRFRTFHEPDLDNQLTAICTEPVCANKRHLFRAYQCMKGGD